MTLATFYCLLIYTRCHQGFPKTGFICHGESKELTNSAHFLEGHFCEGRKSQLGFPRNNCDSWSSAVPKHIKPTPRHMTYLVPTVLASPCVTHNRFLPWGGGGGESALSNDHGMRDGPSLAFRDSRFSF